MQNPAQLISLPTKRIQMPKSKEWLNVRCFTSKEQKNMKMGLQTNSPETVSSTLRQVFESCIQEDVNIRTFDLIDLEYLFLQLTIMSSGSFVDVGYSCLNEGEDGKSCGHQFDVQYDLEAVDYEFSKLGDTEIFDVVDGVQLEMRKPKGEQVFDYFGVAVKGGDDSDDLEKQILNNMVAIFAQNQRMEVNLYTQEQLIEFIDVMPLTVIGKIHEFLSDVDHLLIKKEFHCPKCGTKHETELRGLESFLG